MSAKIFKQLFTAQEIQELLNHFDTVPLGGCQGLDGSGDSGGNKNLDYDLRESIVYRIIRPKVNDLLGKDHNFYAGSYKELTKPYPLHVDNREYLKSNFTFNHPEKHSTAILIPMIEGPHLKTVVFSATCDYFFSTDSRSLPEEWLGEENHLDLNEFDHMSDPAFSQIKRLAVDQEMKWELGDMYTWKFDQLHTSTNFAKYGIIKKFIIIWIS